MASIPLDLSETSEQPAEQCQDDTTRVLHRIIGLRLRGSRYALLPCSQDLSDYLFSAIFQE